MSEEKEIREMVEEFEKGIRCPWCWREGKVKKTGYLYPAYQCECGGEWGRLELNDEEWGSLESDEEEVSG